MVERKEVEKSKSPSKKKPAENEVNNFINARYVGASEALWRLMGFNMHEMSPSVAKLPIHLPDGHLAFVEMIDTKNKTQAEIDAAREAQKVAIARQEKTMLTEFFTLNQEHPEANNHLYADILKYYTFDKSNKVFKERSK